MIMINRNQNGSINVLLLPLVVACVLLVSAVGFGYWAFGSRQDYKNNVDEKISVAVAAAKEAESATKDKQYSEATKLPLKTYNGPEQYGSVSLQYPKTWSAYIDTTTKGEAALDGFFNPDTVPAIDDENSIFALRVQVVDQTYSEVLSALNNQEGITVSPYALPKLPKIIGVKVQGQIENEKKGVMVILPVRDKTLKIYTEADAFQADFNNSILPNLTFSP
jgi:hypothetical protein